MSTISDYWQNQYATRSKAHREQNFQVSRDFVATLPQHPVTCNALAHARTAIEIGCGTGELLNLLLNTFHWHYAHGLDLSAEAVKLANAQYQTLKCDFETRDCTTTLSSFRPFDIALCNHTLEHFHEWWTIVENMLSVAPQALIIVPFAQPATDGYNGEGGAGHVFCFTKDVFAQRYRVLDAFEFASAGWQCATSPTSLVTLLERTP